MKKNIFIILSIVLNIIGVLLFINNYTNMDIIHLLMFCYIPIAISLLFCSVDTHFNNSNHSVIYSIINAIYLIITNTLVSNSGVLDTVYRNSQKYSSTNVTISLDSSPVFSLIILIVVSCTLHVLIQKLVFNFKNKLRSEERLN
mgnify:CR=1 FL=1